MSRLHFASLVQKLEGVANGCTAFEEMAREIVRYSFSR